MHADIQNSLPSHAKNDFRAPAKIKPQAGYISPQDAFMRIVDAENEASLICTGIVCQR
jgi:hypothetical protein